MIRGAAPVGCRVAEEGTAGAAETRLGLVADSIRAAVGFELAVRLAAQRGDRVVQEEVAADAGELHHRPADDVRVLDDEQSRTVKAAAQANSTSRNTAVC